MHKFEIPNHLPKTRLCRIAKAGSLANRFCWMFCICTLVIGVGACPFQGLVYVEDLAAEYAVWATDTIEDAAIVRKHKEGSGASVVIDSTVFAYGWNDDFIIAKQHPQKGGRIDTGTTNWYILEVMSDKAHGPMSEDEFGKLRARLKVPTQLLFKTVGLNADR